MRRAVIVALIAFAAAAAYGQDPAEKDWRIHAAAGVGRGMYAAAGAEYSFPFGMDNLPVPLILGAKAQAAYSPNSQAGNSLIAIGLMPTARLAVAAIPGLELFGGGGFGFIMYLETKTNYKTTIDFYTELGASYSISESLAAFAGLGAYWGDLLCFMAGVSLGL